MNLTLRFHAWCIVVVCGLSKGITKVPGKLGAVRWLVGGVWFLAGATTCVM